MADVTKPVRRRGKRAQDQVSERAPDVDDESGEEQEQDQESGGGEERRGDSGRSTVTSELKDTIREAAIEILRPAARQVTKSAAKYAVTRGPDLVKNRVLPKVEEAGGAGALAKGALSKAKGGDAEGGVRGGLSGLTERLGRGGGDDDEGASPVPMQAHADVAADLQTVYDQFTQFEDFPEFAEHLEQVRQRDDTTLTVREGIRRGSRSWDVQIVEQVPCERIVFEGTGESGSVGVVTFHRLSDHLTRVDLSVLFQPQGLLDRTSGVRAYRRALESDLMRFKAWIELRDETTGSWRGRVEEGEVVDAEGGGDEAEAGDEPEGREDEEEPRGEEEYEDEPEAEDEEEPEAEAEPEPEEEEERPSRRRASRRRAAAEPSKSRSGGRRASRPGSGEDQPARPRSGTGRTSRARSGATQGSRSRSSSRARS